MTQRWNQRNKPPLLQRSGSNPTISTEPSSPLQYSPTATTSTTSFFPQNSHSQHQPNSPRNPPRRFYSVDDLQNNSVPSYLPTREDAYLAPEPSTKRRNSLLGSIKKPSGSISKTVVAGYFFLVCLVVWLVFTVTTYLFLPGTGMQKSAWQREFDCKLSP
jgi:hypothetical protein